MRFVSTFSGCAGFDLGLERAGHECVCQVEIEPKPRSILNYHFPNVPKIKDVRDANRNTLPAFDMLAGGFPCTDVSLAGQREGLAGEASGLWFQMHRIATECRPSVVLIENVPGLFSSRADSKDAIAGEDFAIVLSGLLGFPIDIPRNGWKSSGIARGIFYHVAYRLVDSQYFGVAQQRRRLLIAACLVGSRINPAEILFEREGVPRNYQTCRQARKGIAAASEGGSGICGEGGG